MNFVFINKDSQIMAIQSSPNPPAETEWESVHGYTRVEVDKSLPATRDHKLVDGGQGGDERADVGSNDA